MRIERSGAWMHDGETLALEPGGGLLGADAVFPVLHGPFGEDGTVQGLLELLDVPVRRRRACSPRRCAWTRSSSRRCWPPPACRRSATPRCASPLADRPDGVRERLAALGLPVFVKPARLGSSVGIVKVVGGRRARRRAGDGVRPRRARDRRGVLRAAWRSSARCSAWTSPRPRCPARSSSQGADWYDYEAKYEPGGMELVVPARIPDAAAEEVRRLARRDVRARRLRRPGARRLLRRGRARARQRAQHDAGLHADERVPEAVGGDRAWRSRELLRPPARAPRSSASAPSAAATRSRRRSGAGYCFAARTARSRRSRRARRPAASPVIQTR